MELPASKTVRNVYCLKKTFPSLKGNVNIKDDSTTISQFRWEGRKLTLVGILLKVEQVPSVIKIQIVCFAPG